ncbi:MAG: shikimate dehydrogenase [Paracoccaceae bacterium]|nr:shikimate dehydrogenase [Paracoccaceae bacterium]MDE2673647.1 shikimate dehydrogenase [Paracoccaceae bacterium]MDE2738661.1 shikimate dehydrogenase [Paracoccaceae bacterium]MXZ50832.1 shikimate dehydrogenase [Paracoccaceae bacterium]MYF47282.1 shikimate dehydrogenase [Paracoccaceae bacterium]
MRKNKTNPILTGVIGTPIGHSLSPVIHNYWIEKYGENGIYIPLEVSRTHFSDVIKILPKMGFVGVNITIPHKEAALMCADLVADNAALLGAANTLSLRKNGKIYANNTDGYGFLQNLKETEPTWRAVTGPALVLGAGGGSRAIIYTLLREGVPKVYLTNRTIERAKLLQNDLGNRVKVIEYVDLGAVLNEVTIIVNTTSLGMIGQPEMKFPYDSLNYRTIVYDIVYNPLRTDFLKQAEIRGCRTVEGLGMLLHQAANSYQFWFGKLPEVTLELKNLVTEKLKA